MNSRGINESERRHLAWLKEQACAVCSQPGPSEAHHIEQGLQWACIPLCADCHRGSFNGLHGQRRMWAVTKKTELSCLNETIKAMAMKAG